MPAGQPFTLLCQLAARQRSSGRADLHLHSTHSDGAYTPAQLVDLAARSGLSAIALTDHDTLSGVPEAQAVAAARGLEVVPGVEISTGHRGRELHLLGYFVSLSDAPLADALRRLREGRTVRFREMVERLRRQGIDLGDEVPENSLSMGRRHVAELLVKHGKASTVREAFSRHLADGGRVQVPKLLLPAAEAVERVRAAGGVASLAHPPEREGRELLAELRDLGLGAVEVEYPGFRAARVRQLRAWAAELGLAVSGGSDCHGPDSVRSAPGARSVSREELERLRGFTSRPGPSPPSR